MSNLDPKYKIHDGHPYLEIQFEGKTAQIFSEQKLWTFEAGYVFLGTNFSELTSDVDGQKLKAFTNDPEVMKLFKKFLEDLESGEFKAS